MTDQETDPNSGVINCFVTRPGWWCLVTVDATINIIINTNVVIHPETRRFCNHISLVTFDDQERSLTCSAPLVMIPLN